MRSPTVKKPRRSAGLRRIRGPWRVAVVEASMAPAIEPGDWLLVDPTSVRWPRRGSVVVFREPDGGGLAIKRVAAGPGDRVAFAQGYLELAEDEAWLLSDATTDTATERGFGEPIDSRAYGPVPLDLLVGRAWFRYAPFRRLGLIPGPG
jgi:signal peptidase I